MSESESKLVFKNIYFREELTCDNCEKSINPRLDLAFREPEYGITLCLFCRGLYLENKIFSLK